MSRMSFVLITCMVGIVGCQSVSEPISTHTEVSTVEKANIQGQNNLYETQCSICHQSGLLNAPKLGDKEAWAARIAKGKETLYKHSVEGFNQMPAQAVGDVTEAQIHAAVDYMVEQSS